MDERREPVRTCVGCRTPRAKRLLIRLARVDEQIVVDLKGSMAQRGAYCCFDESCIVLAVRRDRLARAFRAALNVSEERLSRLRADLIALTRSNGRAEPRG